MSGQREDIARGPSTTAPSNDDDGAGVGSSTTGDTGAVPSSQRVKKWAPKVRTGCLTCRARRVKCDEGKPDCHRCLSTGRTCKGYQDVGSQPVKSNAEGSRRRFRQGGARAPKPQIDDRDTTHSNGDSSTADAAYSFDRSLSAASSTNQTGERESSSETHSTDQRLSDLLGGLKVDEQGIAPYLRRRAREDEQLVVDEDDDQDDDEDESAYLNLVLPMMRVPGHKLRIPPPLMPMQGTALRYFELYFDHVHPYVPVLDRIEFYRQWSTRPDSISPLLLEAIFAVGGRLGEEIPRASNRWLALASRHAEEFMDVPRLSTLQALLIILKARESAPKRGYYYRSWMSVVQCVRMAKDLGLDEHYEMHQSGHSGLCKFNPAECRLHTRLWQVVFVCETMIGTPQGRHDLSVKVDTVDFNEPPALSEMVEPANAYEAKNEHDVSRGFTYMARLVRNVRQLNGLYLRLKKKTNWGTQPEYLAFEQTMNSFLPSLPPELMIEYPRDSMSLPWLPSAFLGNLHSYYYLSIILFHRGVLGFLDASINKSLWKRHMMICYNSAKRLCQLQEATKKQFGLLGLQSMQRGFSFTVYAGLSCVVLHLVAIVSPDADLNGDAREYFERHMRVMEEVMQVWPMPDLLKQIDAFREAFSANLDEPFVLRPESLYIRPDHSSSKQSAQQPPQYIKSEPTDTVSFHYHQPTGQQPKMSLLDTPEAGPVSNVSAPLEAQDIPLTSLSTYQNWNPAPIFQTWNSFFSAAPQASTIVSQQSPLTNMVNYSHMANVPPGHTAEAPLSDLQTEAPSSLLPSYEKPSYIGPQQQIPLQYPATAAVPSFITSGMWQHLVATVYEEGQQTQNFQMNPGG